MNLNDRNQTTDRSIAAILSGAAMADSTRAFGRYHATAHRVHEHRRDEFTDLDAQYQRMIDRAADAAKSKWKRLAGMAAGLARQADSLKQRIDAMPRELLWTEDYANVITDLGKAHILDNYWGASSFSALFTMSLIGSTGYTSTPVAADTLASHTNWAEETAYSASNRVSVSSWNSASGSGTVSKATNTSPSFTMSSGKTIKGSMIVFNNSTKGNTASGTLISAGLFTGSDKVLQSSDVLSITYTPSLA